MIGDIVFQHGIWTETVIDETAMHEYADTVGVIQLIECTRGDMPVMWCVDYPGARKVAYTLDDATQLYYHICLQLHPWFHYDLNYYREDLLNYFDTVWFHASVMQAYNPWDTSYNDEDSEY